MMILNYKLVIVKIYFNLQPTLKENIYFSFNEQITNIFMSLKNKYYGDQLKNAVKKELIERQYSEAIINEWLEYI